jgi:hypothetical protein
MRGDDLLLIHLSLLPELDDGEPDERPSARERLEDEVGPNLAAELLARLVPSA